MPSSSARKALWRDSGFKAIRSPRSIPSNTLRPPLRQVGGPNNGRLSLMPVARSSALWSDWHHSIPRLLSLRDSSSAPRDSMSRHLCWPRCALRFERPDPIRCAGGHVAGRAPAAFCTARSNGLSEARGHRLATFASADVMFNVSASGRRQLTVEISRQFEQQFAAPRRRANVSRHLSTSWRAA